jgi:predicted  nucleic acid-binding Zn-ribbon protein
VAEVERTNEENGWLKQAMASRNVEMGKLKSERDAAVRRQQEVREEIGPLKLELQVAFADLKTARSNSNAQQREINRLTAKLLFVAEMSSDVMPKPFVGRKGLGGSFP